MTLKMKKSPLKGTAGTLKCTIRELRDHLDHFQSASKVQRADNEDAEKVNRFKYACGKNAEKVMSFIKKITPDLAKIAVPIDGLSDYDAARIAICEKYCQRDETGSPKLQENEKEKTKEYVFSFEDQKTVQKELSALGKIYKSILSKVEKQQTDIEAYLDTSVEIQELHCVEWKDLPERISGTYLVVLSPMIKNIPEV